MLAHSLSVRRFLFWRLSFGWQMEPLPSHRRSLLHNTCHSAVCLVCHMLPDIIDSVISCIMHLWIIAVHLNDSNFVRDQLVTVSASSNAKASQTEFHGVKAEQRIRRAAHGCARGCARAVDESECFVVSSRHCQNAAILGVKSLRI